MKTVRHDVKHELEEGTHVVPEQEHRHTRGHQVHLDITEHTDPNVIVKVDFEVSTDGGKTWTYGGGFTRNGGPAVDRDGQPITFAVAHFGHEPVPRRRERGRVVGSHPAPRRLIKGTVTVIGGTVKTRLHVVGAAHAGTEIDPGLIPQD